MLSPRHLILASVLVSAGLAAHGGDGGATAAGLARSVEEPPVVDCESRIQVIPSRDDRVLSPTLRRKSVFAGPVVFVGAKGYRNDPHRPFRPSRREERRAVKVRIGVEAEHVVTLELSRRTRRHAVIEIGLDRRPYRVRGPSVELRACPANATVAGRRVGRRTSFVAGGFRLDGPRCVRLAIEIEGRAKTLTRRIAFGRRTCRRDRMRLPSTMNSSIRGSSTTTIGAGLRQDRPSGRLHS
jgi:hypothetical protein